MLLLRGLFWRCGRGVFALVALFALFALFVLFVLFSLNYVLHIWLVRNVLWLGWVRA